MASAEEMDGQEPFPLVDAHEARQRGTAAAPIVGAFGIGGDETFEERQRLVAFQADRV